MNSWYVIILELFIFLALFICFIVFLVMLIIAKRNHRPTRFKGIVLSLDIMLFACALVFALSHPTYYKYNDWVILNSDIDSVISKYGSFDVGKIEKGKPGKTGYYIYTDDGPIMPDHMKHYYWMYFDEVGTVYKVEEGLSAGG